MATATVIATATATATPTRSAVYVYVTYTTCPKGHNTSTPDDGACAEGQPILTTDATRGMTSVMGHSGTPH